MRGTEAFFLVSVLAIFFFQFVFYLVGKSLDKAKYTCRHGMSYSKYSCDYKGIAAEQTLVVKIKFYPKMSDWHMK